MITREQALAHFPPEYGEPHEWQIALVMMLDVPSCFTQIDTDKWKQDLARETFEYGCDWANWFGDRWGNVFGEAIAELAVKAVPYASER